jgi:hypothetical protein
LALAPVATSSIPINHLAFYILGLRASMRVPCNSDIDISYVPVCILLFASGPRKVAADRRGRNLFIDIDNRMCDMISQSTFPLVLCRSSGALFSPCAGHGRKVRLDC